MPRGGWAPRMSRFSIVAPRRHMSAFAFEYETPSRKASVFCGGVSRSGFTAMSNGIRAIECVQAAVGDDGRTRGGSGSNFHFDCQQITTQSDNRRYWNCFPHAAARAEQRPRGPSIARQALPRIRSISQAAIASMAAGSGRRSRRRKTRGAGDCVVAGGRACLKRRTSL